MIIALKYELLDCDLKSDRIKGLPTRTVVSNLLNTVCQFMNNLTFNTLVRQTFFVFNCHCPLPDFIAIMKFSQSISSH